MSQLQSVSTKMFIQKLNSCHWQSCYILLSKQNYFIVYHNTVPQKFKFTTKISSAFHKYSMYIFLSSLHPIPHIFIAP